MKTFDRKLVVMVDSVCSGQVPIGSRIICGGEFQWERVRGPKGKIESDEIMGSHFCPTLVVPYMPLMPIIPITPDLFTPTFETSPLGQH